MNNRRAAEDGEQCRGGNGRCAGETGLRLIQVGELERAHGETPCERRSQWWEGVSHAKVRGGVLRCRWKHLHV